MTKLEHLYDFAYNSDIEIYDYRHPSDIKGYCMADGNFYAAALNKSAIHNSADELCTLAEELGHIKTGAVLPFSDYINPEYRKWAKRRNEIVAGRWAIDKLLPIGKIQEALNQGCNSDYEIAEHCDVTVEFLNKAFEYYARQGIEIDMETIC